MHWRGKRVGDRRHARVRNGRLSELLLRRLLKYRENTRTAKVRKQEQVDESRERYVQRLSTTCLAPAHARTDSFAVKSE